MSDQVLFLGVTNSCRSQMAEALLRRLATGRFEVHSAGIRPTEIHPLTYRVMAEVGIDFSGRHPKGVRELFRANYLHRFAIILGDAAEPDCPKLFPGALQVLRWPFANALQATGDEAERLEVFRRVRDGIDQRIRQWLEEV
jgi:arsenate reductase